MKLFVTFSIEFIKQLLSVTFLFFYANRFTISFGCLQMTSSKILTSRSFHNLFNTLSWLRIRFKKTSESAQSVMYEFLDNWDLCSLIFVQIIDDRKKIRFVSWKNYQKFSLTLFQEEKRRSQIQRKRKNSNNFLELIKFWFEIPIEDLTRCVILKIEYLSRNWIE